LFLNEARNHHFVSQAEQRLNSVDPTAERRYQRILVFDVPDREKPLLKLHDSLGTEIKNNLSFLDLFSFEVVDANHRQNLERVFGKYEQEVASKSQQLLAKLAAGSDDVKGEIVDVFAAKLLNFFRNPYCVQKAMNTFGFAANYRPTDPDLDAAFLAVLNGSRPHAASVCGTFGLAADLYEGWLRALFVLLAPAFPLNLFENIIKDSFEKSFVVVNVFDYSSSDPNDVCLLSDRGFNIPEQSESRFMFEFNLTSRAFACFHLTNLDDTNVRAGLKEGAKGRVHVVRTSDDLSVLAAYNQRTAYQCAGKVFAASPSPRLMAP
jgi:hypothetical protein